MALSRRTGQKFQASIWPGFVDAMTALLLVLMFVLTIFMVVQFVLRETISGQASELDDLSAQIVNLADALGLEQNRSAGLVRNVAELSDTIKLAQDQAKAQQTLIATLTAQNNTQAAQLNEQRGAISSFEAQVASLLSQRDQAQALGETLTAKLSELDAQHSKLISDQEALQLALAKARTEVDSQTEQARLAAARKDALNALIADLKIQATKTNQSLTDALAQLEGHDGQNAKLLADLNAANQQLSEVQKAKLAQAVAAEALRTRLKDLETALSEEEKKQLVDRAAAEALRQRLKNADTELTAMTLTLEEQRKQAEDTLTLLAAANAAKDGLNEKLATALLTISVTSSQLKAAKVAAQAVEGSSDTLRQKLAAALAAKLLAEKTAVQHLSEAQKQAIFLETAKGQLAEAEEKTLAEQRKLTLLNQQVVALRGQLGGLQNLLDESAEKDKAANVQLQALGSQLNTALARVASEEKRRRKLEELARLKAEEDRNRAQSEAQNLEQFKSEFFGQLRQVMAAEQGVRIEGDRFVFSSEVLFRTGDVSLSIEGKKQIANIATILKRVSDQIPTGIDWIIRVDGHTDNLPLSGTGRYVDNWELSQARALSVVRYMSEELGIAPNRLAANGFGEYRPINPENTPEARAQNRRIELKLTER